MEREAMTLFKPLPWAVGCCEGPSCYSHTPFCVLFINRGDLAGEPMRILSENLILN